MRWSGVARTVVVLVVALTAVTACGDDDEEPTASEVTAVDIDGGIDLSANGPTSDSGRVTLPGFAEVAVEVTNQAGDLLEWCLLLARAAAQYTQGLMSVVD